MKGKRAVIIFFDSLFEMGCRVGRRRGVWAPHIAARSLEAVARHVLNEMDRA